MYISEYKRRRAVITKYRFVYKKVTAGLFEQTGIRFNNTGFRHLMFQGHNGGRRQLRDIRHRMSLIPLIPEILANNEPHSIRGQKEIHGSRINNSQYFSFYFETDSRLVCMVIKQNNDNLPFFLSLHEIS